MKNLHRKILIIVRHAHRSKALGRDADNGISEKGREQTRALTRYFRKKFGRKKTLLWSSPKKRCIQTIEGIARKTRGSVEILDCLDESRTRTEIDRRVREFERIWKSSPSDLIVISSHGDFIPALLEKAAGAAIELDKGGWAQLELEGPKSEPKLTWLIQDFEGL